MWPRDTLRVGTTEVFFRGCNGGQGRKGNGNKGVEAVKPLQQLYRIFDWRSDLLLIAYRAYVGWPVWTRDQPIHCFCQRLLVVDKRLDKEGKVGSHD